jgi:TonB-linked SusC/RagA family outer membrane protein
MKRTFTNRLKAYLQTDCKLNSQFEILKSVSFHRRTYPALLLLPLFVLLLSANVTIASPAVMLSKQQATIITIKGKVVDNADNEPLTGVTISDNQKKALGVTDAKGNFNIKVPAGTEFNFGFIGYTPTKLKFSTNQENLLVKLAQTSSSLSEVVVTALGIKRDEKALGYSVTTVKNKELTDAISNNWTDALQGKVAGLNLTKSGAGPAGTNKIILRGETNLDGDNAALIVVDGVVISGSSGRNTNGGQGSGSGTYLQAESPVDFGNSIADINPNDIESVSVLKGPAAAALYGMRASHGAIIITTKAGQTNKGLGITFNSNTAIDATTHFPDYQEEYGQGADGQDLYYSYLATADGASTRSTSSAWGPKFNGQSYFLYDPVTRTTSATRQPWVAYPNNHQDFFNVGKTFTNSISVDGGNKTSSARLSVTNLQNTWIIPNTGYGRNTIALSVNTKFIDNLEIASKVNYTNKYSDNLPSTGYNNQTIMYFIRGLTPNMNIDWFKDYWLPGQEGIAQNRPFSSLLDNPYLIANELLNKSNRNNIIGNVSATYKFSKNLSLMVRTAMDMAYEERSQQRPKSVNKFPDGSYRTQNLFTQEITSDFLARYNNKFNKFTYNITAGGSHLTNHYTYNEIQADKLLYPGVYTLANSKVTLVAKPYSSQYTFNSLYGLGSLSYDSFLYLDITARNDWTSTLATPTATDNVSFFYPSASLSAVLSDKIHLPKQFTFVKVRASIAGTGSGGVTPYRTSYVYNSTAFPGGLTNSTSLANDGLKPQLTRAIELGADIRMFQSRLNFDLTVYTSDTRDQILPSQIDPASGYSSVILNAGLVRNQGIEVAVNGTPIQTKNGFKWLINGTFTANRNKIVSLGDTSTVLVLSNGPRGTTEAHVGGSFGAIYGLGYKRAPDGQIIYNNGLPLLSENAKYIGNANPQWKGSIGSNFSYKRFSLNVLFDGQWGGVGYSLTTAVLSEEGKLEKTVPGRYNGIIGPGVVQNTDGTYSPNTVVAPSAQQYYSAHFIRDNVESNTFSTNFIKFREARLDYNFSPKILSHLKIQRASFGVYGRNLAMWTKWPAFDPEFGALNANGDVQSGFESAQFPSTRTFGINLTIGI